MNEESEWISREEWNQLRRFQSEQMKNILLQLEEVKRKINVLNPKPQLVPQVRDLLDKQIDKFFKKLLFLETEVMNIKKKLNMKEGG